MFKVPITGRSGAQVVDVPMIVTNKHVVENMTTLNTTISLCPRGTQPSDEAITPDDVHAHVAINNLQQSICFHPDSQVDLCAIVFGNILEQIPDHLQLRHTFVSQSWSLTLDESKYTRPIEPVIMVGYPTGLWNEADNRPISRRGLTASHPTQRWNRERKFLIDAACFPGSSGSPVFLFEDGMIRISAEAYGPGTRARFIGILFAGPIFNQHGRFEQRVIPTTVGTVPVIDSMMNLGYVAHADTVDDLIPLIRARIEQDIRATRDPDLKV